MSITERKVPNMTVGQAVLLGLIRRYLAAVMDPTIALLEVHKANLIQWFETPFCMELLYGALGYIDKGSLDR